MALPDGRTSSDILETTHEEKAAAEPVFTSALRTDQPAVAPVRLEERIAAVDTIRGFALLGVWIVPIWLKHFRFGPLE